jgi:hypothetical protein
MWWLNDRDDYVYQFLTPKAFLSSLLLWLLLLLLFVATAPISSQIKRPDVVLFHAIRTCTLTVGNPGIAKDAGGRSIRFGLWLETFHCWHIGAWRFLNIIARLKVARKEESYLTRQPAAKKTDRRPRSGSAVADRLLERSQQYLWTIWRRVMAPLPAQRAVLTIEKNALANVWFHVTFCSLCWFASTVAKGTIRIGNFNQTSARTHRTFLNIGLSHLFYVESTII